MKDLREKLEKLRADAEDCTLISRLASDKAKRDLFASLAAQIRQMIAELEAAIEAGSRETKSEASSQGSPGDAPRGDSISGGGTKPAV